MRLAQVMEWSDFLGSLTKEGNRKRFFFKEKPELYCGVLQGWRSLSGRGTWRGQD